ncbi:TonB-dependent siderophore receptor [Acetobacteraceae bacterium KSS8]|uniref:TonB-dependent siderophore receptor n=1 Tax=Endosaccharibacter trunci TaxID=2812733 RepID=A0ABT1WCD3_9PROT|nr:TonB-dependent siderophore receptor [Acetobacteraceae bacterium KSS8]
MSFRACLLGATLPVSMLVWPLAPAAQAAQAGLAQAASPDPGDPDETLSVLGVRQSPLVPKSSSAATKTDTPLIDTPESVSVVTRAQMDQMNARTLVEALRYTAGVSTEAQNGFSTRYDLLSIRGFTSNADQYVDGLKLFNGAYYANQQIDTNLVDRYDILKGPPSVLYGQSDPGGVINITSKLPTATPLHQVSIEGGSYGYVRGSADLGGPIDQSGHWLYRLAATGTTSGTQDHHTRVERYGVAPAVSWVPDANTTLTVNGFFQKDPRGGDYDNAPIYGTVLPNSNGPIPYSKFTGDDSFERFDRTQAAIAYQLSHRLNSNWSVRSVARYANIGTEYNEVYAGAFPDADSRIAPRYSSGSEEHYDTITLEEQLHGRFQTGAVRHSVLFGVNWQNLRDSYNYYAGSVASIDLYGPYRSAPIPPLTPLLFDSVSTNQEAIFGEDQMSWGRLHLQIGGREDWSEITTRNALDQSANFDQGDRAFTWRAGILYAFANGISPYFNYSRSFQPVNQLSSTGAPFKPTRGEQFEVGTKWQPTGFNGFFSAALFHIQETNVLVSDPNNLNFSIQTGGIRSQGVELEAHADLTRRLNIVAAYTYQDATFNKNSGALDGRRQSQVPQQFFSVWGHYDIHDGPLDGLGFGVGVRYQGNTITDNTVEYATSPFTLVDAEAQYQLGHLLPRLRGATLQVTAQNLLDKSYITSCYSNSFGCYWGTRRNVIGRLTYRW